MYQNILLLLFLSISYLITTYINLNIKYLLDIKISRHARQTLVNEDYLCSGSLLLETFKACDVDTASFNVMFTL